MFSQPVVADTELEIGDIVITVRKDKSAGLVVSRTGRGGFIPENSCFYCPSVHEVLAQITAGFSPWSVVAKALQQ